MHSPTVRLLLAGAIVAALAFAGLLLGLPPLVVGMGVGVALGVLAAYGARLRRAAARDEERNAR